MQDTSRGLRTFAGRLASSSAAGKAYELASKAKVAVAGSATPPIGENGQQQSWKEWAMSGKDWAMQKIPMRGPPIVGVETVSLFPGYATRRTQNRDAGFSLDLQISGFASSLRPPEQATRSQKAFMALAKRMAALPKLPLDETKGNPAIDYLAATPSTQDLLQSREDRAEREAEEMQALKEELAEMPLELRPTITNESGSMPAPHSIPPDQLRRMHANLDLRLQPFWSSSIPNRPVTLSVFVSGEEDKDEILQATSYTPMAEGRRPLFQVKTTTDAQGVFVQRINIPYEMICTNPDALSLAFGEYDSEPKLVVQAELKPAPEPIGLMESSEYFQRPKVIATHISIPVSNRRIRVISDIDDTIKTADVLLGVKTIFHNVFVKGLDELIVPGMNSFYQKLHDKGVRFHYVSNSPYGLLSILTEFMQVADFRKALSNFAFMVGEVFLVAYGNQPEKERGAAWFKYWTISPIRSDTGEQDLELYVDLAKERPHQILGIFLRDVVPPAAQISDHLLSDPWTDEPQSMVSAPSTRPPTPGPSASTASLVSGQAPPYAPYVPKSRQQSDPSRGQPVQQQPQQIPAMQIRRSFIDDDPIMPGRDPWAKGGSGDGTKMTPAEKRRFDLDQRIARARQIVPSHIIFRVFRDPEENSEVFDVIDRISREDW